MAERTGLPRSGIEDIKYEFECIEKATRKARKSLNMKREKIGEKHIKSLQNFVLDRHHEGFKRWDAQRFILKKFPTLGNISLATISRMLKSNLRMSYKKLWALNPRHLNFGESSNLAFWAKIILGPSKEEYLIVFLDEFLINRNTTSSFGWTQKGQPGRIIQKPLDYRMSFVIAHSNQQIEGWMGTVSNMNRMKYLKFIRNLIRRLKAQGRVNEDRIIIYADNCRIHRAKIVEKEFMRQRTTWLFIPAYHPEINPWEKLINFIKSQGKREVSEGRYRLYP